MDLHNIQFLRYKSIAFFPFFPRRVPLLDFPSDLRRDFCYQRPELFVLLFEPGGLQRFADAGLVSDLFFQPRVLLRQIVNRGLVFLHLSQMCFQPGKELVKQRKGFLFLLPGVHHGDLGNSRFNGLLLLDEADGLFEQPCGDVLPFGDKGAFAPFEDGEHLFHMGVKLILPAGELRPVAQYLLGRQPAVLRDGRKAQVQVGRLLVHVYHGGEDIVPPDLLLHKGHGLGEVGLDVFSAPALEELRACRDEGVHKHGAVFPCLAACRFDPAIDLLPVLLLRLDDMKVVFASCYINVGIAGVFLLRALMVCLQRARRSGLVLGKP